jgi:type I restriction enzyme S subunit
MPDGWSVESLRELIEKPVAGFWGEDVSGHSLRAVRVVRNGDAASHYTLSQEDLPRRWMLPAQIAKAECRVGDVLLASSGEVGAVARLAATGDEVVVASNFVRRIRARKRTDASWLFFLLQTSLSQSFARKCSGGTTLQNLSGRFFDDFLAPVPLRSEQRRIGEILDAVDDAIRSAESLIAKLSQVSGALLNDLMTRGIGADGVLRNPILQPDDFVGTKLGQVPRTWRVIPLAECVKPTTPITYGIVQAGPDVPDGVPYIRTGDMASEELRRADLLCTSARIANAYRRSTVQAGDIVCAIRATVGKVLPVPANLDGANLTQGTARISPGPSVHPGFLLQVLRSDAIQRQFAQAIKGTTFAEITLAALRELPVPIPDSFDEQRAIADRMAAMESKISVERDNLDALLQLKAGLMDDLLTGRVRVKADSQAAA